MFTIDFTKPWLYKDIIYFNQGNLSTNNTLRCKLVTGGSDDFTGGSIACTFTTKDSIEISGFGRLVDAKGGIVDIVFPSNALVVGTNKLEILVNRADGGVAQSPSVLYDIWQGLTTGNGVEAETNYPILIELINSTNEASNKANSALNKANSMITDITDAIDNAYRSANDADIATSNANSKIEEVETAKTEMIKQVDNSIANMKIETNTAINSMTAKTDEKITDVNIALAAGTKDLEVKEARKDANGVVHDTLEERLKSDLIVGDKSLKDFVVDMNGMKETQDLAYETNTGYKVCNDTQVGVVKDLKLCGKSLFNLGGKVNSTVVAYNPLLIGNISLFKNSQKYTFIIKNVLQHAVKIYTNEYQFASNPRFKTIEPNSTLVFTDTTLGSFKPNDNVILKAGGEQSTIYRLEVIILEGDHTQNPPQYFEGIASVGNGNEIEFSSIGVNLLDYKDFKFNEKFKLDNDIVRIKSSDTSALRKSMYLPPNTEMYIRADINCVDSKVSFRGSKTLGSAHDIDLFYLHKDRKVQKFTVPSNGMVNLGYFSDGGGEGAISNVMLSFDDINYIPFEQDKKPILFKDVDGQWKPVIELRGVDLNNCDTIENNKYYVKTEFKTFIGSTSEGWGVSKTDENSIIFALKPDENKKGDNNIPTTVCNIFKSLGANEQWSNEIESCSVNVNGQLLIRVNKNRLISNDVNGFMDFLSKNNMVLIYLIKKIKSYEVNPLELESFDNITLWLILSGVIAPPANFKVTSSLPNFVKNVDTRVKRMENDFYKYTVTQNRMQLGTTYSSDRTTFRVDTATFSTEKAKQDLDYDLFRLLKHNIIVGPQNYDKAEMENIMDFYVSVGKIDYNMWDELYMLIEEQHNPPVEEEAPVI